MRHEKIIPLDENRNATVRELRVKDVRRLVNELQLLTTLDITVLFGDQFDRLLAVAGDLVTMPEGETAEDLSLSETEEVVAAMKEVNAGFLAILAKLGLSLDLVQPASSSPKEPSENSIEQPAE